MLGSHAGSVKIFELIKKCDILVNHTSPDLLPTLQAQEAIHSIPESKLAFANVRKSDVKSLFYVINMQI